MPNNPNESKRKVWCTSFSNCFAQGTPSKTWTASTFTDVIGLGCKVGIINFCANKLSYQLLT